MQELFKKQMEDAFEKVVEISFKDDSMRGTPLEGMGAYSAIGNATTHFKETFKDSRYNLGLTEKEINLIIDESSTKILKKYFEI